MKVIIFFLIFCIFASDVTAFGLGISPKMLKFQDSEEKEITIFNPNDHDIEYELKVAGDGLLKLEKDSGIISAHGNEKIKVTSMPESPGTYSSFVIAQAKGKEVAPAAAVTAFIGVSGTGGESDDPVLEKDPLLMVMIVGLAMLLVFLLVKRFKPKEVAEPEIEEEL